MLLVFITGAGERDADMEALRAIILKSVLENEISLSPNEINYEFPKYRDGEEVKILCIFERMFTKTEHRTREEMAMNVGSRASYLFPGKQLTVIVREDMSSFDGFYCN